MSEATAEETSGRAALPIRWGLIAALVLPYLALPVVGALAIRVFAFEAFEMDGPSMEPSVLAGDRFVVDKAVCGVFIPFADEALVSWAEPEVGDVFVIRSPFDRIDIVKRVVAVAGDTVEIRGDVVYLNGRALASGRARPCEAAFDDCEVVDEAWGERRWTTTRSSLSIPDDLPEVRVPEGHVFVLGDHRDRSNDSRNPQVGMIALAQLKGRVPSSTGRRVTRDRAGIASDGRYPEMARPADAPLDADSPLADPGMRLAAQTIDVGAALLPLLLLVGVGVLAHSSTLVHAGVASTIAVSLPLAILNLWWLHRYGQTLGKRVLGLRIVRASGERVGLLRILLLRIALPGLLGGVPYLGYLFVGADALMIFSDGRQTIHDRIADTVVVDLRRDARVPA